MLCYTTATLLLLSPLVGAKPTPLESRSTPLDGYSVPITRRMAGRTADDFLARATKMMDRYAGPSGATLDKRQSGVVTLTDQSDSEYYGTIMIGSPPAPFNVVLDTGSSDLIIAAAGCVGCTSSTPLYSAGSSSTSQSSTTPFQITYGSGAAAGTLAKDVISIGGYTVESQVFAACTTLQSIVTGKISGLLGLGWQGIASSRATPLVQALAQNGSLPAQVIGFAFLSYTNAQLTSKTMPGGTMTVGSTDTSKFSGSINWIPILLPSGYWAIPLQAVYAGGKNLGLSAQSAVIDTGTSLIGVPANVIASIYAQVPGSKSISLQGQAGYYSFDCASSPNVSFTFGGIAYAVPPSTFNAGAADNSGTTCLGAIFAMPVGSQVQWIFGDAFLTGVYNAYRFSNPPAVGFATLGSGGTSSTSSSNAASSSSSTSSAPGGVAPSSSNKSGATRLAFQLVPFGIAFIGYVLC